MKKKIKDLTLRECKEICDRYECRNCPLCHNPNLDYIDCPVYDKAFLEKEVDVTGISFGAYDKVYKELKNLLVKLEKMNASEPFVYLSTKGEFGKDERTYYLIIHYIIKEVKYEYEYKLKNKEERDIMEQVISWLKK